jgi:hypothetical protein
VCWLHLEGLLLGQVMVDERSTGPVGLRGCQSWYASSLLAVEVLQDHLHDFVL